MLPLFSALAVAGPVFSGANPVDVEVASRAWALATRCNGREALTSPEVEIVEAPIEWGGLAHVGWSEGLHQITIQPLSPTPEAEALVRLGAEIGIPPETVLGSAAWIAAHRRAVVVHEVAHAWAWGGPATLDEGRAMLLVDCILDHDPSLAPRTEDDGERLVDLPDLLTWQACDHDPWSAETDDAYRGARRLMRLVSGLAPEVLTWPHTNMTWHDLHTILSAHGVAGEMLWDKIEADLHGLVGGVWQNLRDE